jgi:hypothetical protein
MFGKGGCLPEMNLQLCAAASLINTFADHGRLDVARYH